MSSNTASACLSLRHRLTVLVLFGIVFGYAEGATVAYIRATYEPIHQRLFPDRAADDLFPLFTIDEWAREGPPHAQPLMEVARELCTLVLVALVALGVSRNVSQWFASFVLAFGVWDLAYYAWLVVLLGWPRSVWDWDLVFAAPLPWVSPVLAPMLVATVMVITAGIFFWCEAQGRPVQPRAGHWIVVLLGGVLGMVAFCWDYRNTMASGVPTVFNWPLLLVGLLLGVAGFAHALLLRSGARRGT